MPDDEERYAPSVFMSDYPVPDPFAPTTTALPRGVDGGIIEAVKRAVVTAIREELSGTGMRIITSTTDSNAEVEGNRVYVDLEYPLQEVQYPGIWVQFSISSLRAAGIDHGGHIQDEDGAWCETQEMEIQGRVSLLVVGLASKDRDRLADSLIAMLSFSRPPNPVLTRIDADTQEHRALQTALARNPHVALVINSDIIYPSGESVNIGVPWQPDALAYENTLAFDVQGLYNIVHRHDGTYALARVDFVPETSENPWSGLQLPHSL